MSTFMVVTADHMTVGSALLDDGELTAAVINDIAFRCDCVPTARWMGDFLDEIDEEGRKLVKAIAAAIDADEASEGGA